MKLTNRINPPREGIKPRQRDNRKRRKLERGDYWLNTEPPRTLSYYDLQRLNANDRLLRLSKEARISFLLDLLSALGIDTQEAESDFTYHPKGRTKKELKAEEEKRKKAREGRIKITFKSLEIGGKICASGGSGSAGGEG